MNSEMSNGFRAGSGVDADALRLMLQMIGSGVILLVFAWIVVQLFNAYSDGKLSAGDAAWGGLKVVVLLGIVFYAVFL